MATRTSAPPRKTGGKPAAKAPARKPAAKKPAARKAPARKPAAKRPPARRHAGPGPLAVGGKVVGGAFRALAGGVGGVSRAAGSSARDLDPAHRRDGLGLLLLIGALLSAGGAWWHAGSAGDALASLVEGAFGKGALVLPVVLAVAGVRVLRHPEAPGARGRLLVGWTSLSVGALGVLHVVRGDLPRASKGGLVGFLLGDPLEHLLTGLLAVPVLLLLAAFGLLVVTATPVHQVPTRLAQLRDRLLLKPPPVEPEPAPEPLPPLQRNRPRRRVGVQEAPEDVNPVVVAVDERPPAPPEPPPHTPAPKKAEQLVLKGDYLLPPSELLGAGTPPKTRSAVNDEVIAALSQVLEDFQVDARVTGFSRGPTVT
ncbi:MAG: hypothetical protein ACXVFV_10120, partial [Mycobacteriales bacterium]